MSLLEVQGLSVAYGNVAAVNDVSLTVRAGSIACILGANGAGKSSLLKAIVGMTPVKAGKIFYDGVDITGMPAYEAMDHGICLCPEGRRLFPGMTVLDNLRMGAYRLRSSREFSKRLDYVYELFPRLQERCRQVAGSLSGGEQQMVAIGRVLMGGPRLLLMDEPSLGLAPKIIAEVAKTVREINRSGITVMLVEQNARLALRLSEIAYVLETGRLSMQGAGQDLLDDPLVKRIYLGE